MYVLLSFIMYTVSSKSNLYKLLKYALLLVPEWAANIYVLLLIIDDDSILIFVLILLFGLLME